MKFDKPALSIEQLIVLLRSRGLIIDDEQEAAHYLKFIGYYRLSGYALPLSNKHTNNTHTFKTGTKFSDILNLYKFDRELRILFMDAIERVEVAFRACVSDTLSVKYGCHWYLDKACFRNAVQGEKFVNRVAEEIGFQEDGKLKDPKTKDVFIQHYLYTYDEPKLPPSWMIAEVLSISFWSKALQNLANREDRKDIANSFGLNPEVLEPWMHCISYTRNICAHHARLWNREFTIKPMIAKGHELHLANNGRVYAQAYIINQMMTRACPSSTWWSWVLKLVSDHPYIDRSAMGFPKDVPLIQNPQ